MGFHGAREGKYEDVGTGGAGEGRSGRGDDAETVEIGLVAIGIGGGVRGLVGVEVVLRKKSLSSRS